MNVLTRWPLRLTLPLLLLGGMMVILVLLMLALQQNAVGDLERTSRATLWNDLTSLRDEMDQALPVAQPLQVLTWNLSGLQLQRRDRIAALVDEADRILLSPAIPDASTTQATFPLPLSAFSALSPPGIEVVRHDHYLLGVLAVPLSPGRVGRLLVAENLEPRQRLAMAEVNRQVLRWGTAVMVLAILAWWLLHRVITARMGRFLDAGKQMEAGDLSVRLGLTGGDELSRMGQAFDALIERLGHEQRRLEGQDYLLRNILLHSPVMVFLKDEQGRYLLGNPLLAQQLGCDEAALIGKSDRQLWPEAVADVLEDHDRQVLQEGKPRVFEEVLGDNGKRRSYLMVRFPLDASREGGARLGGIATDLSQNQSLERRIRRKDELLASLSFAAESFLSTEVFGGGIAEVLAHLGRADEVNQVFLYRDEQGLIQQWHEVQGVTTRRVDLDGLGLRWWKGSLRHEGVLIREAPSFTPSERAVLEPEGIQTILLAPITTDEGWWGFLALASSSERRWAAGEIEALQAHAGLIGAAAARQHAQRDRARSERRFRAIFEQSEIGMVVSSQDGRFVMVNPAFARMLGYDPQQMIGWTFPTITHPDDRDQNLELFQRFQSGEIDHYGMEKRYLSRTGQTVWGRLAVRALREDGEAMILSLIEDITPQKEMAQALEQVEARYHNIIATSNEGFVAVDPGLRIVEVNDAMLRILGYEREEVLGRRVFRYVAKGHWATLRRWRSHPDEIPQREIEMTAFHRQGYPAELLMSISPLHKDGHLEGFVAFASDLSQRKRLDQAILAAKVFERTSEAVVITDAQANIVDVNDAWERITGYRREEVVGKNPRMMQSGRHGKDFYRAMWRSLMEEGRWEGEIWDRRKDGQDYPKHLVIDAVRGESGAVTHYVGIFTDITEAKAREDHLHKLAHRDHLTGLPNRLLFMDRLGQAMQRVRRSRETLALLFIDLDGFKAINDRLGHRIGDEVLVEVARRLTRTIRQSDTVCRLGGDEFIVLLSDVDGASGAIHVAEKVLSSLTRPIATEVEEQVLTASIGIAFYPGDGDNTQALIQAADLAMYEAKSLGKNRYHLAGDYTPVGVKPT